MGTSRQEYIDIGMGMDDMGTDMDMDRDRYRQIHRIGYTEGGTDV